MSSNRTEYRVVCALHGTDPWHRAHAYKASERVAKTGRSRDDYLTRLNADPIMDRPGNRGCVPWRLEAREIGPWQSVAQDVVA